MKIEQIAGESDASHVARMLVDALDELGDTDLNYPVQQVGPAYLMMIGPHSEHGFCWCQPSMESCLSGQVHKHPVHRDFFH